MTAQQHAQADEDPLANYDPGPEPEDWADAAIHEQPPARAHDDAPTRSRPQAPAGIQPIEVRAEQAVLAAVLVSADTYDEIGEKLTSDDFGVPAHSAVFAAVVACDAASRAFDPITVADEMRRQGTLARSGGLEFLEGLVSGEPELEHLADYVDIIIDRALRRRMVSAAHVIGAAALDASKEARAALDVAEHTVFELGQQRQSGTVAPMTSVVAQIHEEMRKARECEIVGHATGLTGFDAITGGLRGGQLVIIAARPGMGKSVLATQIAHHISASEDVIVPVLTYEMTQSEVGHRLLSATSNISLQSLLRGVVPAGRDRDLAEAAEKLASLRLLIDDRPPQTISGVRSAMRRLARRGRVGAIVVDYLQLMNGDGGRRDENRTQEVSAISRGLKLLGGELDVPVIAVSQLSRGLENRPNKRPLLSDLRESGSLEQDANLVGFLYRDHVYDKAADPTHAELIIAKNRQGPQDTIPLDWDAETVQFRNTTRTLEPVAAAAGPGSSGGFGGGFGGGGRNVVRPDPFSPF